MSELEYLFLVIFLIIILIVQGVIIAMKNKDISNLTKLISNLIDDNVNLYVYYIKHSKKELEPFEEYSKE